MTRVLRLALALALQAAAAAGCATTAAVYDVVVPSPVDTVRVARDNQGRLSWTGYYGRSPETLLPSEMGPSYVHQHLDRSGSLDLPASLVACEPFVLGYDSAPQRIELGGSGYVLSEPDVGEHQATRSPAQAGDRCAYLIVQDANESRSLRMLDAEGRLLHEHELPAEIPLADPRRVSWLVLAPAVDIAGTLYWTPIAVMVVIASPVLLLW